MWNIVAIFYFTIYFRNRHLWRLKIILISIRRKASRDYYNNKIIFNLLYPRSIFLPTENNIVFVSHLIFLLRLLVKFTELSIQSNLQSHLHGLFSSSITGTRFTSSCNFRSNVSTLQSFIEKRCNRGSMWLICSPGLSWINRLQPIIDNVSRLVKFSRSLRSNDVKFDISFSHSSRSCGRYKFLRLVTCVPDKSSSCRFTGSRGIALIGFHDKSRNDKLVKVLNNLGEKYGADMFLKSRCFSVCKFKNAPSCIPSPIGLLAKERYSRIWKVI